MANICLEQNIYKQKIKKAKKINAKPKPLICVACKESFQYKYQLQFHIRQHHFNLVGFENYAHSQNVKSVWVEKVMNTDILVELRKVNNNILLIQKVKDDTIKPTKIKREVIDVQNTYPVRFGGVVDSCRVCQESFARKMLNKHFLSKHTHLVKKQCDTCGIVFKDLYNCVHHICLEITIK